MTAIPSLGYYPRTTRIQADGLINRLFATPLPPSDQLLILFLICVIFHCEQKLCVRQSLFFLSTVLSNHVVP
jgi:hypothetical protein